jgi:protein XagA
VANHFQGVNGPLPCGKMPPLLPMAKLIPKLVSVIISILLYEHAFAGAWVQEKDHGLSITTIRYYESHEFWDQSRNINDCPRYRKLELNQWLEYGLTENLTIGLNAFIPYIQAEGQGNNAGLGDLEALGRYRIWKNHASVLSTQLLLKIPGPYDDKLPLLGQGQYDLEWRLLYGGGGALNQGKNGEWFANIECGFRKRFGPPADEIRLDWIVGWKVPNKKLEINFRQENILGLRNNSSITASDPYRERSADYDLHKFTLSGIYSIDSNIALQVGVTQDVLGRNIGKGVGPLMALWMKF